MDFFNACYGTIQIFAGQGSMPGDVFKFRR